MHGTAYPEAFLRRHALPAVQRPHSVSVVVHTDPAGRVELSRTLVFCN